MNRELEKWNFLFKQQNNIYHRYAKNLGLSDTQFWVLYAICESKVPICQNEFCKNWSYSKQTVSAAVANLEKLGLIYLEFAKGSKKQKNIILTQKGEDFSKKYIRKLQSIEEKIIMKLSEDERKEFFRILTFLMDDLEKEIF